MLANHQEHDRAQTLWRGLNRELPIQERVLYPAPRSMFIGLGLFGLRA